MGEDWPGERVLAEEVEVEVVADLRRALDSRSVGDECSVYRGGLDAVDDEEEEVARVECSLTS